MCVYVCVCVCAVLTVFTIHHCIVALLSESYVSKMEDPCNNLQHSVPLVKSQAHDRHGLLKDDKDNIIKLHDKTPFYCTQEDNQRPSFNSFVDVFICLLIMRTNVDSLAKRLTLKS